MFRRSVFVILSILILGASPGFAANKSHKLVLQISDASAQKMNLVLNVATQMTREITAKGDEIDIEIVTFGPGLNMLRPDKTHVAKRLKSISESLVNVSFYACRNTMKQMTKKEGKMPEVFKFAKIVPAGAVYILERSEEGWTVIRP